MKLFYLPDLGNMEIQVILNESVVRRVNEGLRANVDFEALPGVRLTGQVTSISQIPNQVNPRGEDVRYFLGTVKLDRSAEGLKPGMTAAVTFDLPGRDGAIAVPLTRSPTRTTSRPATSWPATISSGVRSSSARQRRIWSRSRRAWSMETRSSSTRPNGARGCGAWRASRTVPGPRSIPRRPRRPEPPDPATPGDSAAARGGEPAARAPGLRAAARAAEHANPARKPSSMTSDRRRRRPEYGCVPVRLWDGGMDFV